MSKIEDIKDRTPNQATIEQLESMLGDAKAGRLRTLVSVCGWDDDSVTHSWSQDPRNSQRRILAELVMLQHNFVTNLGFMDGDSVLAQAFEPE